MTMHKSIRISAIATGMLFFAGSALAHTDDATVNAYAGIAPVLTLTCTDVNFGVWKVAAGSRSAATTITLAADASNTATSSDSGVALSLKKYSPASAGACDLNGSLAPDGTLADVVLSNNTNVEFIGQASTKFAAGILKPAADAALRATITASTLTPVITNGTGRFYLGGVLTIPNNLNNSNYGGYITKNLIGIAADDKQI
ncbi:MAG: hypothetical protein ACRCZ4_05460 [Plesiomonas sp.]|uniref:hypothetical protein n=1 Tax=Plesiomonas sp. TaxID=2486279 RepID=UPI003F2A509B